MGGNLDILSIIRAAQGDSSGLTGAQSPDMAPAAPPGAPPSPPSGPSAPPSPQQPQQLGPRMTGIKGYLSNIFYNMGEAAKVQAGIPTDAQVQANQLKLQNEQMQTQADLIEKQARAKLYTAQAGQVGKTVMTPYGELPVELAKAVLPAQIRGQFTLDAAKARIQAQQNQMSFKAAYGPDGQIGLGMYDKQGNFRGMAENGAVPSEYLEKIHQGQEAKFDANGNLYLVGTTSRSKPIIPAAPQTSAPAAPGATPSATPPAKPGLHPILNNAINGAKPVTNAKPVMVNGQQFQGPTAADTVYATDPKSGQTIFTSRADAAAQGLTNLQKVSPVQRRKDEALSNRLADVQRKVGDYAETFDQPIDDTDRQAIAYLMQNPLPDSIAHMGSIPLAGYANQLLKSKGIQALSDAGMKRFILFNQARESLSGYQQILTNSSRSSDKVLELQLEQLPHPLADKQYADATTGQFQQNLDLAGQHMPIFPGSAENQQSIKAQQANRRAQTAAIQANQDKGANIPPRPANVPGNYIYKVNGPKGTGWYRP